METERYLAAVRRARNWIVAAAVLAGLGGFLWASSQPPQYRASAAVFFQVEGADSTQGLLQGSNYAQNQVRSYAELARKEVVLDQVADDLDLQRSGASLAGSISVNVPLDTAIVEITATAGSPEDAQALANAAAGRLGTAVEGLSKPSEVDADPALKVTAQTVQQAGLPSKPFSPTPVRDGAMGLIAGLALALGVVLLREFFNNKVTDEDSLTAVADVPLLGQIPWSGGRRSGSVALQPKDRAQMEAIRRSAANFEFVNHSGSVRAVVITAAQPAEGKSTVASTLALALSANQRVLLIDADMRKPTIHKRFGLEPSVGLTTIITGKVTLDEAVQHVGRNRNLSVVTCGAIPPNPLALIGSEAFAHLIAEARNSYDAVIIDSPPLLPVADAALLARVADGAILVVASRKTTTKQVSRALGHLSIAEVPIHGAILTMVKGKSKDTGYYGETPAKKSGIGLSKSDKPAPKPAAYSGSR